MCFYNGLDAYSKTWFQFLFPLYIWFILSAIIIVSHYSTRMSRLVGNNTVQVLATLFLFSYVKLLRIIITAFSSTVLVYPNGYHRRVWLYDGNIDYLRETHPTVHCSTDSCCFHLISFHNDSLLHSVYAKAIQQEISILGRETSAPV